MRSTPAALSIPLAAALLLTACSRPAESPTVEAAASAAVTAAVTPAVAAAVAAGSAHEDAGIAWRKPKAEAEADAVFAEARSQGKPVFVYWGAEWCPPCSQVKATVFVRPEFIEKSRGFLAVYLDGDLPGAQKLGERFKVRGYPTMILFRPDGSELTRLPGEVDAQKYLQVLALGLGAARPVKEVFAQARSAPSKLSAEDWRLLAYYSWDTDEQQLLPKAQLAATLQRLAQACPPDQAEAGTRLMLKALVAQAAAEPAPKRQAPAAARERVLTVLAEDLLARENLDIVSNHARDLSAALTAPGTPAREELIATWAATLDRLTADTRLSQGDRLSALISRIDLAKLELGIAARQPAPLSAVLKEHVQREAARMDREVTGDNERNAVITGAAYALAQAGLLDDSDRLLQSELKRSQTPYYAMLSLAANAKRRNDKPGALDWYERAYRESQGPATRVQWGVTYVTALLELSPEDGPRIDRAASSVLAELQGQEHGFYERNTAALERMSAKLLAWNKGPEQAAVLGRLRTQRDGLCAALPAGDPQRATCAGLLATSVAAGKKKPAA